MKTRLCIFVLLLTSVSATIPAYSQGEKKPRTAADYRQRTLSEFTTLQPDYIANNPEYKVAAADPALRLVVHADLLPSRVTAHYDGTSRPLSENRKILITQWANRKAPPEFDTAPYGTEMLFTEDGKNYWLVVKTEFVSQFEQEFRKGDAVELFLVKLGNIRIDDKMEPVLLVEKIAKP